MANTFSVQVGDLVGTFSDEAALDQWMGDGVKEIINLFPPHLLKLCTSTDTYTSQAVGSESSAATLNTGKILSVFAGNYEARLISNRKKHKAANNKSIEYAISTNPVYYIEGNYLNSLPSGLSCVYEEVQYPTVDASADTAISVFPDEAEYLVVLYTAIKALQQLMVSLMTNSSIVDAFALVKDAVDQAATAAGKFIAVDADSVFGDEDTFETDVSQLTRVKDALDNAEKIIDDGANSPTGNADGDAATYLYTDEDIELMEGTLKIAASEIQRAQEHLSEWVAIGDMRVKEVGVALSEADGYIKEIEARMKRDSQKYQWYQAQQVKLQQDYSQGLEMLLGGSGVKKGKANDRK